MQKITKKERVELEDIFITISNKSKQHRYNEFCKNVQKRFLNAFTKNLPKKQVN